MTMKIYPCARYHAHLESLCSEQSTDGPAIERDASFCAYACNSTPVALEVPDADAQFWSCPCAVARAMRDAKQENDALWDTVKKSPVALMRVRALIKLADMHTDKKAH